MGKQRADEIIRKFDLSPHPEGGHFRETYRASVLVETERGPRAASTAIHFLLRDTEFSAFHRIESDEMWHLYEASPGTSVRIWIIGHSGEVSSLTLSPDAPQVIVPAGVYFAAELVGGPERERFAFVGCTVSPGFDFADFEMPNAEELQDRFPHHTQLITDPKGQYGKQIDSAILVSLLRKSK